MTINKYEFSYDHLVNTDFLRYMGELETLIRNPVAMEIFSRKNFGVKSIASELSLRNRNDFSGCYVLLDQGEPIYVGISRGVVKRLRQHVSGKTHFDASLAYRMARSKSNINLKATRQQAMNDSTFQQLFEVERKYIKSLDVAFVEIENAFALYCFEPYCALKFGTSRWNTFETH